MEVYLDKDHNNEKDAKILAEKIKEVKLKEIISGVKIDFANKKIEITLDSKALKSVHVGAQKIIERLQEKGFGVKGDEQRITLNASDLDYKTIISPRYFSDHVLVDKYDAVIHLGANSSTSQEADASNWENNISFSKRLINRVTSQRDKPVIIFASSAAVYGNETSDFSERLDVKPTNFYGFTKLMVEKEIEKLNNHRIFCLRFFNVYGARERHKREMASPIYRWLNGGLS